jgi:hypothetical protein
MATGTGARQLSCDGCTTGNSLGMGVPLGIIVCRLFAPPQRAQRVMHCKKVLRAHPLYFDCLLPSRLLSTESERAGRSLLTPPLSAP